MAISRYVSALAFFIIMTNCLNCSYSGKFARGPVSEVAIARSTLQQRDTAAFIDVVCVPGHPESRQVGSGAIVSPTQVLTAKHVITCKGDAVGIINVVIGGITYSAQLDKSHDKLDLSVLKISGGFFPAGDPYPMIGADIREYDLVFSQTSYPKKERTRGIVQYAKLDGNKFYFSNDTVPGNSGSPVYNGQGELVGVVVSFCTNRETCGGGGIDITGSVKFW